jgi:hypothetical protein
MDLCYKTSDNKYHSSPPRMNDGRHFTDYRSNNLINNLLIKNNKVHNNYHYKSFLIKNSEKLRELNWNYACQKNCHKECPDIIDIPHQSEFICNHTVCHRRHLNNNGIGIKINNTNSNHLYTHHNDTINNNKPNNSCKDFDFFFNK